MARASITMTGATTFEGRLTALEDNLERLPLVVAEVFKGLEEYYDKTWGQDSGQVTDATVQRWPNRVGPLELTGRLRDSLTKSDAPGAVRMITPYGFEFGTAIFYANLLQKGTKKMEPHHVIRHLRSTRALVGYLVRREVLRGVVPVEGSLDV